MDFFFQIIKTIVYLFTCCQALAKMMKRQAGEMNYRKYIHDMYLKSIFILLNLRLHG